MGYARCRKLNFGCIIFCESFPISPKKSVSSARLLSVQLVQHFGWLERAQINRNFYGRTWIFTAQHFGCVINFAARDTYSRGTGAGQLGESTRVGSSPRRTSHLLGPASPVGHPPHHPGHRIPRDCLCGEPAQLGEGPREEEVPGWSFRSTRILQGPRQVRGVQGQRSKKRFVPLFHFQHLLKCCSSNSLDKISNINSHVAYCPVHIYFLAFQ